MTANGEAVRDVPPRATLIFRDLNRGAIDAFRFDLASFVFAVDAHDDLD